MSSTFINVGNSRNPDILITQINNMLNTAPPNVPTVYEKIAMVDSTSMAEILNYPMRVSTAKEVKKKPTEQRDFNDAEVIDITCRVERVEAPGTKIPIGPVFDTYGLLKMRAPDEIKQAMKIWDRSLAALIAAGGVYSDNQPTYDKLPFFGAHSSNPGKIGAGSYNNDISANPDEAGFLTAWETMQQIPGYDDTLVNVDMGVPLLVVPTIAMKLAFDKLLHEGLVTKQVSAAAASENTRLVGWAEVVHMPELLQYKNIDANIAKRWFLVNRNDNARRGFIVRNPVKPQFRITTENDVFAHTHDALVTYYKTYGGVNYGLPHLVMRATTF